MLDEDRDDECARAHNIVELETRFVAADIKSGPDYMAEAEPDMGPRRYSISPSIAVNAVQRLWVVVN